MVKISQRAIDDTADYRMECSSEEPRDQQKLYLFAGNGG